METHSSSRIKWIDIAKGIGIFYVILSHKQLGILDTHVNSFFMPFFFFLSGCTFSIKNSGFVKKKVKSLLIPYASITCVLFVIYLITLLGKTILKHATLSISSVTMPILGSIYNTYSLYDPSKISSNVVNIKFLVMDNGPLWFLTCLFVMEVMFYMIIKTSEKYKCKNIIYVSLILFALVGYILKIYSVFLLPWSIDTAFSCLIFFGTGFVIKNKIRHIQTKYYLIAIVFLLINICFYKLNSNVEVSIRAYGNFIFFYISAFAGIGFYVIISQIISKNIKLLDKYFIFLGKNTLVLLGFHLIAFKFISAFFKITRINLSYINQSIIYGLVYTILATIILIPVIYLINNKIPWIIGKYH